MALKQYFNFFNPIRKENIFEDLKNFLLTLLAPGVRRSVFFLKTPKCYSAAIL